MSALSLWFLASVEGIGFHYSLPKTLDRVKSRIAGGHRSVKSHSAKSFALG